MTSPVEQRKRIVSRCRRVVLKAGTRLLTSREAICRLAQQIAKLRDTGVEVIFVSSGAVGVAMKSLGLKKRPRHLSEVQSLAAIGQVQLMSLYEEEFQKHGHRIAQLLLTADDLRARTRYLNAVNCLETLLSHGIIPIINENDPVSVASLKFGDNDILAAMLGTMLRADLTVILTTVDGLLKPKADGTLGDRISIVRGVTGEQRAMARGTDDSSMSIGGMTSKLKAAELVNSGGEALWIADGTRTDVVEAIFRGDDIGTLFLPANSSAKREAKRRWLASFSHISGTVCIDDGAADALRKKGASLLPSGATSISGTFKRGDVIQIIHAGTGEIVGNGITNFSSAEAIKLLGCHSNEVRKILECDAEDEMIHRNNMVLFL